MENYNKKLIFKPVISLKTIYAVYIQEFNEVAMKRRYVFIPINYQTLKG